MNKKWKTKKTVFYLDKKRKNKKTEIAFWNVGYFFTQMLIKTCSYVLRCEKTVLSQLKIKQGHVISLMYIVQLIFFNPMLLNPETATAVADPKKKETAEQVSYIVYSVLLSFWFHILRRFFQIVEIHIRNGVMGL